jgi:hypothetical protein
MKELSTQSLLFATFRYAKVVTSIEPGMRGNCPTKNSVNVFKINDLQRCLVYPFMLIFPK